MAKELLSPEKLRNLFRYEPDTGLLFWQERPRDHFANDGRWSAWNKTYAGKPALNSCTDGRYLRGTIGGVAHYAHRVIWAVVTGEWPKGEVDHVDLNKKNNAWANLRVATRQQNMRNRPALSRNATGLKGVCRCSKSKRWIAQIAVSGKTYTIGRFKCQTAARLAYIKANAAQHGAFGRVA